VRYVVRDDPSGTAKADRVLEQELTVEVQGYVNLVVLAEFAWVLWRTYRFDRTELTDAIERLLDVETLVFQNEDLVYDALDLFRINRVELPDILINLVNHAAGCSWTATLDQEQRSLPTARVL
jgi:predicted nucleic-acid-binding protein